MLPRKDFYVNKILEIQMPFLGITRSSPACRPLVAHSSPTHRPFTTAHRPLAANLRLARCTVSIQ
jgi:hypothetical protein